MRPFSKPSFGDLRWKPRHTAAAAREHRRVLAPRLPTPGASVTSPLHTPREVLFEVCQRRVLLARIKGEVRQVQFCKWTTTIALPPHAGTRGASMRQRQHAKTAPACENCASRREEGFHRGQWKPDNSPREGGVLMRSSLRPRTHFSLSLFLHA